ncbi:MAG: 1-deoxy-D-xylulose-5-phosphate reductoisomerase, partial [Chloroflexi bacterium]|nr:1-deoxy-D-xylulose-5-phosphate reductoisomerase [Chloroflexota bacterium]
IIHSMVQFVDGSVKAQLSQPDMRLPIQYALFHPRRVHNGNLPRLDPLRLGALSFVPLDEARYPCFRLALEAGQRGGTFPAVLSAADEAAVGLFLAGKIGFLDIPRVVTKALDLHNPVARPTLEEILDADRWARETVCHAVGISA